MLTLSCAHVAGRLPEIHSATREYDVLPVAARLHARDCGNVRKWTLGHARVFACVAVWAERTEFAFVAGSAMRCTGNGVSSARGAQKRQKSAASCVRRRTEMAQDRIHRGCVAQVVGSKGVHAPAARRRRICLVDGTQRSLFPVSKQCVEHTRNSAQ